ncbi:MAG: hypothetical protein RIK87_02815, partial [Fuerstiella sp.]
MFSRRWTVCIPHFRDEPHEPGNARQAFAILGQFFRVAFQCLEFQLGGFGGRPVFVAAARTQLPPAQSHIVVGPVFDHVRAVSEHHMKVVVQNGKPEHLDA